jgi:hypothetical protein
MSCGITDPLACVGPLAGDAAASAWDGICLSFAAAADVLLKTFARAFTAIPPVDLASPGVKNVYAICLGIAAVTAVLVLLGQVIRTALTHDGSALAEGLAGIGKAAVAFVLTLVIASAAVTAADSLTAYIITSSFGSAARLTARITSLLSFAGSTGHPGVELAGGASLLLLLAIAGILLILVLWFELLLRNAAIVVLVATSPIAAAGMASPATRSWWPKVVSATGQLIIVKPVIALVFALGLEFTGTSHDIETLLAGMLILLLAAVAWPVIARFFTFANVGVGGSAGLGIVLGFAAGRLSASGGSMPRGGGGASPGMPADAGGEAGAAAGEGAAAGGAAAVGAAAGVLALAAAGVQAAHRVSTALAGRMDGVAGDAGLAPPGYGQYPLRPTAGGTRQGGPLVPSAKGGQDSAGSAGWHGGTSSSSYAGQASQAQDWPEPDPDPWRPGRWPEDKASDGDVRPEPPPADDMTSDWPSSLPWPASDDDDEEPGS